MAFSSLRRIGAVIAAAGLAACLETTAPGGGSYEYEIYLPPSYSTTTQSYPLILSLHGEGGLLPQDNLIEVVAKQQLNFPFIVVAPVTINAWSGSLLGVLLDSVEKQYRVDKSRVYVTGLSMGASGGWGLVSLFPDRFAAMALIAGQGSSVVGCTTARTPLWAFHNRDDPVVPVTASQAMVETHRQCGGDARLTIYDTLAPGQWAHNAWQQAWTTPALYDWLLSKRR
jgi:predicted peptidase